MQLAMHMVIIEDLMPREHFLRKLEAALERKGWRSLSGKPESAAKSGRSSSSGTSAAPTSASAGRIRSRVT